MKEENEEDFTKYEDDIIILLNKLSTTIDTFNTLSRDQAEKAILETNLKLNNCKELLDKMEQYIKDQKDEEEINKTEINKKILNYKTEYQDILNKFKEIQEKYINKKTENALLENEKDLIDEDENKNKDKNKNKNKKDKQVEKLIIDGELNDDDNNINNNNIKSNQIDNNKDKNNKNDITLISVSNNNNLEHNNSQILNYSLNPKVNIETDEAFNQINKDYNIKKKKTVLICVAICIFIFVVIILSATLSRH